MGITASPDAASSPAVSAASLPKFRLRLMSRIIGDTEQSSCRISAVRSVEPSSTKRISHSSPVRSRTGAISVRNRPIVSSSFRTGTMIDRLLPYVLMGRSAPIAGTLAVSTKFNFVPYALPSPPMQLSGHQAKPAARRVVERHHERSGLQLPAQTSALQQRHHRVPLLPHRAGRRR